MTETICSTPGCHAVIRFPTSRNWAGPDNDLPICNRCADEEEKYWDGIINKSMEDDHADN